MGNSGPFGFDPEEFDRMVREAGEGLRDAIARINSFISSSGDQSGLSVLFDQFARNTRTRREQETTGETGEGVWAIYTVHEDGGAHVEEVYATELDALLSRDEVSGHDRRVRRAPHRRQRRA